MNFSIRKQPALLTASVLGLTLAVTACANTNNQTPDAGKPMMLKDGSGMNQPHGDRMMQRDGAGMNQRDDRMMGKMGKDDMGRKMAMLNLTAAQQAQVQQLHAQHQAQVQQQRVKIQQLDANIAAQKQAGASTATLLNLYKQRQDAMQQFMTLRQQQQQQFMNILTPEQQLKLYESRDGMMHNDRRMGAMDGMKQGK